jgi:hypothetical protein
MIVRKALMSCLAILALCSAPARAGPCTNQIYDTDLALGKRLNAAAAQGSDVTESTAAKLHRQPTPRSVANAEERAGDLTESQVTALTEDMDQARSADAAGNLTACQKALADVQRVLAK